MKIAIFTNNYLPNPFGVAGSIESFRREFEKRGHIVYIFAPKFNGYIDENPNIFRYPSLDLNFKDIHFPIAIPYSLKIRKILKDLEIDVIHSQHPNLLGSAASKWAKKKNVPLIFTWHTLYDQYTHFVPPLIPKKVANWWVIRNAVEYANGADFVVVPTESVKKIIVGWGVSNENMVSIPTGVNIERFNSAKKDTIRKKYSIPAEKKVLVLVSRFTDEKNIPFIFKAISVILKKRNDAVFLVKGEGQLLPQMKKLVLNEKIAEKVIFADDDKVGDVFVCGDLFVYASKSETQGMIISEAMYCGLPVVAVEATGVSDQVMDGASGFLTKESEEEFVYAIEKILDDDELQKRFSENGQKIAMDNYTSEVCAERMLTIYRRAIEGKNK